MAKRPMTIHPVGDDPTIAFAAEELAAYLEGLTGRKAAIEPRDSYDGAAALWLGTMDAFPHVARPVVPDPRLDDAIDVDVRGQAGVISGINARSVLLAAYRYLTEAGCRWVRPGEAGAFVPKIETLPDVRVAETPSYRHRAVCIEGAVSFQHVRDMVDWLPKLGFNGYYIQFREAHTFFDRWYSHLGGPNETNDRLSKEQALAYTTRLEREIKKRSLLYHKVGHGWTCEPFGISGLGWEKEPAEPVPEIAQYLAEVDGKRAFWGGIALNTNLCYSNPDVRCRMVENIASYVQEHPEVDYLHVWLADGSNNNCECDACRQARPADFYVMLLNEIDAALTAKDLPTKIVFLIYVDLLWPPERERIRNAGRFVLMFAPIVRTYSETFRASDALPEVPPYVRNKLEFPSSVDANVAFLKAWQAGFDGDSFDFDYHLMWDHVNDPGHMHISRTISEDMKGLRAIGLNGFVSCQIQRVFFPTGLPMTVMGRTLWDADLDFDDIARDYFAAAFGPDSEACREYLTKLSELFDPVYLRGERPNGDAEAVKKLQQIIDAVDVFEPVCKRNTDTPENCRQWSWLYLSFHASFCIILALALKAKASGDDAEASELWQKCLRRLAWDMEAKMGLDSVFDAWLFCGRMDMRFK